MSHGPLVQDRETAMDSLCRLQFYPFPSSWIAKHKQCKELNAIFSAFLVVRLFLMQKTPYVSLHQDKDNAINSYLDS